MKRLLSLIALTFLGLMILSSVNAEILIHNWGVSSFFDGTFKNPHGVALDSSGNVYVADTGDNRVEKFTMGPSTGPVSGATFDGWLGKCTGGGSAGNNCDTVNQVSKGFTCTLTTCTGLSPGVNLGQFTTPWGIALDSGNNVFVVDSGNNRVQVFDSSGKVTTSFGCPFAAGCAAGTGDGQLSAPEGIGVDSLGNAFVADTSNNRIERFILQGSSYLFNGWMGGCDFQLLPNSGCVNTNPNSNAYHSNGFSCSQSACVPGQSTPQFIGCCGNPGQFLSPSGVAVDASSNLYTCASTGPYTLQKFDSNNGYSYDPILAAVVNGCGNGVAVDSGGNIYSLLAVNSLVAYPIEVVDRFNSTGALVGRLSTGSGTSYGQLNSPGGIAVDPSGNVYVADTGNSRIQIYAIAPMVALVQGTSPTGELYWNAQYWNSSGWIGWRDLNLASHSAPAYCPSGPGRMELLVRGPGDALWHNSFSATGWKPGSPAAAWSGWDSAGGVVTDKPSCAVRGGVLHAVVRGGGDSIWYNSLPLNTGVWGTWTPLPGSTPSAPTLIVADNSVLNLFVRGEPPGNGIYRLSYSNGAWSNVYNSPINVGQDGATLETPAAASICSGALADCVFVIVRGTNDHVYVNQATPTGDNWAGWSDLNGTTSAAPAVVAEAAGIIHVVVRGTDGGIYDSARCPTLTYQSAWCIDKLGQLFSSGWTTFWGSPTGATPSAPGIGYSGTDVLLLVQGTTNGIHFNTLNRFRTLSPQYQTYPPWLGWGSGIGEAEFTSGGSTSATPAIWGGNPTQGPCGASAYGLPAQYFGCA